MGKGKLVLYLMLIVVFSLPFISAQSEEFKIYSKTDLNVCSCSSIVNTVIIENTANIANSYSISTNNPYVILSQNTFVLKPRTKIAIKEKITIPCTVKEIQDVQIIVINDKNYQKSFTQAVNSELCNNLIIQPIKTNFSGNPCEGYVSEFKIFNQGPFDENYEIEVPDFEGEVNYISNIYIKSKAAEKVEIEFVPKCSLNGLYNSQVNIKTKTTKLSAIVPIEFNIEKNYQYIIESDEEFEICKEESISIPVKIKNEAEFSNFYSFTLDTDSFELSEEKIEIESGEEKIIYLHSINDALELGEGEFEFKSVSEIGEEEKSIIIKHNALDCYSYNINLEEKEICVDEDKIEIIINYTGEKSTDLNFYLESDEFFTLDKDSLSFEKEDEKSIDIEIDTENINDEINTFVLHSNVEGKNISESHEFELSILSLDDCYRPVLSGKTYVKHIGDVYRQKYLTLKNTGIKESKYDLSLESEWVNLPVNQIILNPDESKVFPIETWAENLESKGTYPIEFKIVSEEGQEFHQSLNFVVYDYSFSDLLKEFKCFIGLGIALIFLVLFLILSFLNRKNKKKHYGFISLVFLSIFLIFLNLNWCFGYYNEFYGWDYKETITVSDYDCVNYFDNETCQSEFYIRWNEDTTNEIDLEKYFFDPDGNILTYSINGESENISIGFKGNVVRFIPKKDWYGTEEINFVVSDASEYSAKSPEFSLHVINTKEFYLSDFILEKHNLIFILSMILSALLFFVFVVMYMDVEEDDEYNKINNNSDKKNNKIKKIKKLE
ncbi:Ig-like domain-containing protein [archaeon]|jgi:hypothetical protein|nr:Ig-like domain-containing protein [archaeon]MBT4352122.1 Ig-like domain-containing protein [archaeon]MBT4648439.1 Ig-like domain-containing protein [archaeon]MBT6821753.1 Ig-like domain-containing protein [archaeon]MBT7391217.1 Ig-like domain-containing protein [archaeon]